MVIQASLVAVGVCLLAGAVWVVLQLVGALASDEAAKIVSRRPAFAMRRDRYPGLIRAAFICTALSLMSGVTWAVIATNGFSGDAGDGEVFAVVTAVLVVLAGALFTVWWKLAGRPRHY